MALLEALDAFITEGSRPTSLELAHRALLSTQDTKNGLANLVRSGQVTITGYRRVHYRNRPVAEYGITDGTEEPAPEQALFQALNAWRA